jgi:hypothetical protein
MMRTIREEQVVSEIVDGAREKYPRLEEVFEGLKWYLSRVPDSAEAEALDDINWLYRQDGDAHDNIPAILIIYTFDANYVTLKFVDIRDPLA